jgi:hypothetical protein
MGTRGRPIATVELVDGGDRLVTTCTFEAGAADLSVVDALGRLALGAQRAGWELRVVDADPALLSLLHFIGLGDVVAPSWAPTWASGWAPS